MACSDFGFNLLFYPERALVPKPALEQPVR